MNPLARMEEVTLHHGPLAVVLRPSLRAAMTLERLHDGWDGLLRKVEEFDTATITAILRAAAVDRSAVERLLTVFGTLPLIRVIDAVRDALRGLLALFLTPADDAEAQSPSRGRSLPWAAAYANGFRLATGVLGWTPAEAWVATVTEINEALVGRSALFGDEAEASKPKQGGSYTSAELGLDQEGYDPEFDRAALHALRARL